MYIYHRRLRSFLADRVQSLPPDIVVVAWLSAWNQDTSLWTFRVGHFFPVNVNLLAAEGTVYSGCRSVRPSVIKFVSAMSCRPLLGILPNLQFRNSWNRKERIRFRCQRSKVRITAKFSGEVMPIEGSLCPRSSSSLLGSGHKNTQQRTCFFATSFRQQTFCTQ